MVNDPSWCSVGSSDSSGDLPDGCKDVYLPWFPLYLITLRDMKFTRNLGIVSCLQVFLFIFDSMCLCVYVFAYEQYRKCLNFIGKNWKFKNFSTLKLAITNFGNSLLSILNLNIT